MHAAENPTTSPADEATLLRLLVDAAREFAIFATDANGIIMTWNPGVQNITGYEEHEFIGQNCAILFTPEDREQGAPEQERETARRGGQALDERWHLRKDGSRFWGSGFMHALYDEGGNLHGFAKILRDQTEQKEREEEMERRVRERTAAHLQVQRQLLMVQEDERRRISRELHDSTGQHLAALGLELALLERAAITTQEAARDATHAAGEATRLAREAAQAAETAASLATRADAIAEAARLAHEAAHAARTAAIVSTDASAAAAAADAAMNSMKEAAPNVARLRALTDTLNHDLHRLAIDLRPTSLDELGLVPALRAYVEECPAARLGATVTFESVGLPEGSEQTERLPDEVETAVYRIVQEALTNAAKYAVPGGATQASVVLQRGDGYVLVMVEDNGPGFDPETVGAGRLGLLGMRERALLLGGTLEIESAPGTGATVFARIPAQTP